MFRKLILGCLSALLITLAAKAQDPHFSQFYAAPLYLNPAFAGNGGPKIHANYRNQWPGINKAYTTYAVSYDQYLSALNGGLGVMVLSDDQGDGTIKTNTMRGMYSYNLKLNDNVSLKPALAASFVQSVLNTDKLVYRVDLDNNALPSGENLSNKQPITSFVDFSAGLLIYSESFYAGFAADHLTEPNQSFTSNKSILPSKYTGHLGAVIPLDGSRSRRASEKSISPNIMYQKQGSFNQLNTGVYYNAGPLVLGLWYRYAFRNLL
jgi:type IX secretion system PorP/SprF family membrane protein